jgi:hypothetical protein
MVIETISYRQGGGLGKLVLSKTGLTDFRELTQSI